jgi:hypothetical protein
MKMLEQFQPKLLAVALLIELCAFNSSAFAAAGDGSGGTGGSGTGGSGSGEVLGDLVVLLRNDSGIPILTAEKCQQPLAADGTVIPVDPLTCAVVAGNETKLQAVDFARMSVARSPAKVMDKQLADILVNLSTAQCLTLDPAGRLVYSSPDSADVDGDGNTTELLSSAVDSPLQNLAIYRELMTKGALGTPAIALPNPFTQYGILDTAAKALGAASDKGGKINIDLVVYLNQILGLDQLPQEQLAIPKIPLTIRQEVQGQVVEVTKYFLDYSAYNYERSHTYGTLPFPQNIPAKSPKIGFFDYLTPTLNLAADGRPLFNIISGLIVPTVFESLPSKIDIGGFAQAGDDARAVIEFMHSHPVMVGYEAPVQCDVPVTPPPAVDVSSKLQMPTRMVGNTTREGTLTVSNLKGALATGSVTLIGRYSGGSVTLTPSSPYSFSGLAAGQSKAFAVSFKAPRIATTISWTAIATAEGDNNATNNTATFETKVTAAKGQGGRGEEE